MMQNSLLCRGDDRSDREQAHSQATADVWTKPGAHLLLQIPVHVLNDELGSKFPEWYPGMSAA
jgi:hypothetical protein